MRPRLLFAGRDACPLATSVLLLLQPGCDMVEELFVSHEDARLNAEAPEAEDDVPPERGFVVLEHDTMLHRRPSPDAPAVTLSFETSAPKGRRFAAFELLEMRDGWAKIRPLSQDDGRSHCASSWPPLHDFDVSVWVRRSDLVWVVRSGTLAKHEDGSSAMLSAGTPLERGAKDGVPVRVPQLGIHVDLPSVSIGHTYALGPLFPVPPPVAARPLALGSLRFGEDPLDLHSFALTSESPPRLPVHRHDEVDGVTFVGVGMRCAELRLREPTSADWLNEPAPPVPGELAATADPAPVEAWTVGRGAEVFWPDMEPAGTVRTTHTFAGPPTKKSDKRCFEFGAGWSRICVRADDLERTSRALSDDADDTISDQHAVDVKPRDEPPPDEPDAGEHPPDEPDADEEPSPDEPTADEPTDDGSDAEPVDADAPSTGEPTVRVYKAQITGSMDRKSVAHILKLHRKEALACYADQLEDDPKLAGSVQLVLTISPRGVVKKVQIRRDTLGSSEVRRCLIDVAKRWGFARPQGGGLAVVKQTLTFSRDGGE